MTTTRYRLSHLPLQPLMGLFIALASIAFIACSNSEIVVADVEESAGAGTAITDPSSIDSIYPHEFVCDTIQKDLSLDDTEYPYAGLPRIVIETENLQAIKDKKTEIPAKLQIWGEHIPESEVMDLTIRGRGNTSWGMPKKSYKIEFTQKQEMLGMPKERDWALIANYADKTLIRNHLIYQLSKDLNAPYSPRNQFVELYINNEYLGIYQLTETIKVCSSRINPSNKNNFFLIEFDKDVSDSTNIVTSQMGKLFTIHYPKNVSEDRLEWISTYLNQFENFLQNKDATSYSDWLVLDDYIRHYWLQEFSNNLDGDFNRSVYFTITNGKMISMGPIWDFDLSFGNYVTSYDTWRIRESYWNKLLFSDTAFLNQVNQFWIMNHAFFESVLDSIDDYKSLLEKASKNNFKRWDILKKTTDWWKPQSYDSYDAAVDDLKNWITQRILWIDSHTQPKSKQIN